MIRKSLGGWHWLHHVSLLTGLSARRARQQSSARILMYHGVGGVDCPASLFEAQITYLKRHFKVISLEELVADLDKGRLAANTVALTFDDGLRNNLTVAGPLFYALEIPATFFVCPTLMENRCWLWNHELRQRLKRLSTARSQDIMRQVQAPHAIPGHLVEWAKGLPLVRRRHLEQLVRDATPDFTPTEAERQAYDLMTWEEVRQLDPRWITIGSHSCTHRILVHLEQTELEGEIVQSRQMIETHLGRKPQFFCYPNGFYDLAAVEMVRSHYAAAVTTTKGQVKPECGRHLLPRIGTASNLPLFAWNLFRL